MSQVKRNGLVIDILILIIHNPCRRNTVPDYRMTYDQWYPGSEPSRFFKEEFQAVDDQAALAEYHKRGAAMVEIVAKRHTLKHWVAGGLVRIDQREVTTKIEIPEPIRKLVQK